MELTIIILLAIVLLVSRLDAIETRKHFSFIKKQNQTIMATLAEVQQAITDLQTSVDTKQAAIAAAIAALEAQIAAGVVTPADLQGIVDSLKSVQADVDSTPTA